MSRYWFHAKSHGWGWGLPAVWQGWVVLGTWLLAVIAIGPWLALRSWLLFGLFIGGMAATLVATCYVKGPRPRWRWDEDA